MAQTSTQADADGRRFTHDDLMAAWGLRQALRDEYPDLSVGEARTEAGKPFLALTQSHPDLGEVCFTVEPAETRPGWEVWDALRNALIAYSPISAALAIAAACFALAIPVT